MMESAVLQRNAKRIKLDAPLVAANDGVLPTDVLQDVLLRLPADVLCRFRLVCRSWRSLTSDPIFAKTHSSCHPLVVSLSSEWRRRHDHEVQLLDPLSGNIVKRIHMRQAWDDHEVLSTDIGWLCIFERYTTQEKACVLNPATGAITTLPTADTVIRDKNKSHSWSLCVLGRVPSTVEYKVLLVREYENWPLDDDEPEQTYHVMTLDSRDVSWRVKPCPPFRVDISSSTARAVVKGVAYFLLDVTDCAESDDIAAFDLATEEWRCPAFRGPCSSHRIDPENGERLSICLLANINGCLVSICRYTTGYLNKDCSMVDLWFLTDAETGLWTKRYSLRSEPLGHPDGLFTPLAILGDGRILVWVLGARKLRAYDSRTNTWANMVTLASVYDVVMYQGSLLCSDIKD